MNVVFEINFRRQAYQEEVSRARRRALAVGTWLAYFGVLAVVLGLYGLNLGSLLRRTRQLEVQNAHLVARREPVAAWRPGPSELRLAERALASPRTWQLRLTRLAELLPANAELTSLAVGAEGLPGSPNPERLSIQGTLRPTGDEDGTQGVTRLLSALQRDSLFAAQYRSIQLVGSRREPTSGVTDFMIECR
jgi:hypothetical protein